MKLLNFLLDNDYILVSEYDNWDTLDDSHKVLLLQHALRSEIDKNNLENKRKLYEGIYIFSEFCSLSEITSSVKKLTYNIPKTNIKKYEQLGRKKLAYKVKDNENGFFITFNYLLTNEELEEIQKRARTDEKIIKFINT